MNKSNHNNHICDVFNKQYAHRQNLWRHKKTHIKNEHIFLHPNNSKSPPDHSKSPPDNSNSSPDNTKSNFNILSCKYCNKKFTRIDNLTRHINSRCSKKQENNLEDTIKKQTDELNQLKSLMLEQSTQLKSIISKLINKNCKVHPKTLQKINKQLNGDHNTINENINKGTINNTYNIIALGHENLSDVFSKKEKKAILKYRYCSLLGSKEP
jgi:hypothetical protein